MAHEVIAELQSEDVSVEISLDTIVEEVARTFNVTVEEIKSSNRRATLSKARQIAIYLVKDITNMSMEQIGSSLMADIIQLLYIPASRLKRIWKLTQRLKKLYKI